MPQSHEEVIDLALLNLRVELFGALEHPDQKLRSGAWDLIETVRDRARTMAHPFKTKTPGFVDAACSRCGLLKDHSIHRSLGAPAF